MTLCGVVGCHRGDSAYPGLSVLRPLMAFSRIIRSGPCTLGPTWAIILDSRQLCLVRDILTLR